MTPVFTFLSWSILGENNGVLQPRVKTCSVATRFDAKKKNSFRGEKKKKLVSWQKKETRFVAENKNSFRGNSFRGGKKKHSFRGNATSLVVKFDNEFSHEINVLTVHSTGDRLPF